MAENENGGGGQPWHQGVDAAILGHWQNKNYDLSDPGKVAIEATKAAIAAQAHIGVPPDRLLKLPEKPDDAAGWNGIYTRLGKPAEAKDYDFAGIKFSDGSEPETGFLDTMRTSLHREHINKDAAPRIIKDVIKYLEDAEKTETTAATTRRGEQLANLDKSWGVNKAANLLQADNGARRLGLSSDDVKAIGDAIGADRVAELMRRIGAGTTEDTFVEGRTGGSGSPATREGAIARIKELEADKGWVKRFLSNGVAETAEYRNLHKQAFGEAA
jgi:hypothetical protein